MTEGDKCLSSDTYLRSFSRFLVYCSLSASKGKPLNRRRFFFNVAIWQKIKSFQCHWKCVCSSFVYSLQRLPLPLIPPYIYIKFWKEQSMFLDAAFSVLNDVINKKIQTQSLNVTLTDWTSRCLYLSWSVEQDGVQRFQVSWLHLGDLIAGTRNVS